MAEDENPNISDGGRVVDGENIIEYGNHSVHILTTIYNRESIEKWMVEGVRDKGDKNTYSKTLRKFHELFRGTEMDNDMGAMHI